MKHLFRILLVTAGLHAAAAAAMEPVFTGQANLTAEQVSAAGSYLLPTGPWAQGQLPGDVVNGRVTRRAWHIPATDLTSMQLLENLRSQLADQSYQVIFECETRGCGGFDFRFAAEIFPEPEMHVNLGDFRFLSVRGPGDERVVSILVSRSRETGFVQLIHVGTALAPALQFPVVTAPPPDPVTNRPVAPESLAARLETQGHATLDDLEFPSGGATLGTGEYNSLEALSNYLKSSPARHVTLVGHTDSVGSLAGNIALSKRRAQSVMTHLTGVYNVAASQVSAEGMGYLAPRASNLTDAGREANRRVEVILTSTE